MIKITLNDLKAQQQLKNIALQLKQPRKLYGVLGETLMKIHQKRFKEEVTPDGQKWKPLSARTKALKAQRGKSSKILRQDGYLSDKLAYNYGEDKLEFGSDAKYARLHQFGGNAGRGKKVVVPARPWLGTSDKDEQHLLQKATALLRRQIEENL